MLYCVGGLQAVHLRHANVHEDEVRPQEAAKRYSLAAVAGLAHDPDTRLPLQHAAEPAPDKRVVAAIRSRIETAPSPLIRALRSDC